MHTNNQTKSAPLSVVIKWLLGITKPVHLPLLFSLFCRILNLLLDLALFAIAAGAVVGFVINDMLFPFSTTMLILVVIALLKAGFAYFEQFSGHYVAFKALELLRITVFSSLWPKAPSVVTHTQSGDILTSLTRDVDRIEVVYAHTFAPLMAAYIVPTIAIIFALFWVPWSIISGAVICLAISLFLVPYVGTKKALKATQITLKDRRGLNQHITDSVFGMSELIDYNGEQSRLQSMAGYGDIIAESSKTARDIRALRRGLNLSLSLMAAFLVIWMGSGTVSLVVLAMVAAVAFRIFEGPRGIEDAVGFLDHSLAAARRLWEMSHLEERVKDGPQELNLNTAPEIAFNSIEYAYPKSDGKLGENVLHGIDFRVPAGGYGILVGRSGSGKSTLAQLLLRYDDPQHGNVEINNKDIRGFTLDSLRRNIVSVSQKNDLLRGSIRENLLLGAPNATEKELWDMLEIAGLTDEIKAMPDGLDTDTGEAGTALSGGQKQRICLARALLMKPGILILDEFTANLNIELEKKIRQSLQNWSHKMTILEITHRLAAVENADIVGLLDRGEMIMKGSPADVEESVIAEKFSVM